MVKSIWAATWVFLDFTSRIRCHKCSTGYIFMQPTAYFCRPFLSPLLLATIWLYAWPPCLMRLHRQRWRVADQACIRPIALPLLAATKLSMEKQPLQPPCLSDGKNFLKWRNLRTKMNGDSHSKGVPKNVGTAPLTYWQCRHCWWVVR